jgi:hypothetical protein
VDLLGIDRKSEIERLICEEVNDSVMDYMMAGIEIISGKRGHQYFGVKSFKTILFWFHSNLIRAVNQEHST